MLNRIDRKCSETQTHLNDLKLAIKGSREDSIIPQESVESRVDAAAHSIKLDTRKLLRVCAGLRLDVNRFDRSSGNFLQQRLESHTGALQSVSSSVHISITQVRLMVGQLLRLFTSFSVEVLRHLKSLGDSNVEVYSLLLRILETIPRSPTGLLADNIIFVDALQRQHNLQYAYFCDWEVFQSMLRCKFKDLPGYDKVLRGEYHIMRMNNPNRIIIKSEWSRSVFPGAKIDMSIILALLKAKGRKCPRRNCVGMGNSETDSELYKWLVCYTCKESHQL